MTGDEIARTIAAQSMRVRSARTWFSALLVAISAFGVGASAQTSDPRIQLAAYNDGQVYTLPVLLGFAGVVEFAPDETVESVVVGDSAPWQVTTSARGDRVVVKPLAGAIPTNMVVVTDQRRYVFFLTATGGAQDLYVLRFTYPEGTAKSAVSRVYRISGARRLRPASITDDGHTTIIVWDSQATIPAISAFDEEGEEGIVNGRMVAGRYLVEGVYSRLVFRLGRDQAVAQRQKSRGPR